MESVMSKNKPRIGTVVLEIARGNVLSCGGSVTYQSSTPACRNTSCDKHGYTLRDLVHTKGLFINTCGKACCKKGGPSKF